MPPPAPVNVETSRWARTTQPDTYSDTTARNSITNVVVVIALPTKVPIIVTEEQQKKQYCDRYGFICQVRNEIADSVVMLFRERCKNSYT